MNGIEFALILTRTSQALTIKNAVENNGGDTYVEAGSLGKACFNQNGK